MIQADEFQSLDYFAEIVKQVYSAYQAALRDANAMDFDDLLLNMVLLLRGSDRLRDQYQARFESVLVDEFQDTNKVQYELVKILAAPQNNVFVSATKIRRFMPSEARTIAMSCASARTTPIQLWSCLSKLPQHAEYS